MRIVHSREDEGSRESWSEHVVCISRDWIHRDMRYYEESKR